MLILASASIARQNLLSQAGIPHKVIISGFDEESIHESNAMKLVERLAMEKALAVKKKLLADPKLAIESYKNFKILGLDSVFEFQGHVFGKPRNAMEAKKRLKMFSSKYGVLHTGHALTFSPSINQKNLKTNQSTVINQVISTAIHFDSITNEEINDYVNSGEPMGCAGCFTLEGRGGLFINRIDGCYSNVLGLSLPWLRKILKRSQ